MLVLLPFAQFLIAMTLAAGLNWLALIPWRRTLGAHWTERARLLYPLRVSAAGNVFLIPAACLAAQNALQPELPLWTLGLGLAALPGAVLGNYPMDREIFPDVRFRSWLHEVSASWILQLSRIAVFIGAMILMPREWDWRAPALALSVVALQTWLVWGGVISLARALRLLAPAPERLLAIVQAVAQRLGVPSPRVWVLRGVVSNALALPHTQTLLFTERLLATHPDEEITAVCAHEFGHLTESRRVLLLRYLTAFAFLPCLFINPVLHAFGWAGVAALAASAWLLSIATRSFAQRMEHRADAIAVTHEGEESGTYARALARLYETNQIPAVMPGKRQLHPHLYDRLVAAGVTPDYPRPAAAKARSWPSQLVGLAMFGFVFTAAFRHAERDRGWEDEVEMEAMADDEDDEQVR